MNLYQKIKLQAEQKHKELVKLVLDTNYECISDKVAYNKANALYATQDFDFMEPTTGAIVSYKAGQWVQLKLLDDLEYTFNEAVRTHKIRVIVDSVLEDFINDSKAEFHSIGLGKSWTEGINDVAYLYIKPSKTIFCELAIKAINDIFTSPEVTEEPKFMTEGRYEFNIMLLKVNVYPCSYNGAKSVGVFKTDDDCIITGNPTFCNSADIGKRYTIRATVDNGETINHYKRPTLIKELV